MKQGEKTRSLIIDTADRLFYHRGYGNTAFSHIVEETGLSKGNITYHFKTKQAILQAIIDRRLQAINALLASWANASDDPSRRLLSFCDMLVNEKEDLKHFGCPMGTLTGEFSKYDPELQHIVLPMFERFREWLAQQFLQLGLSEEIADERALELLARVQGIAVVTHVFGDAGFLEREIGVLKREITDGQYRF